MKGIYIGLICIGYSLYLIFISPKEKNMLGYKSLQLNMHKDIWKWTNECFGLLSLIGSIIYFTLSVILELNSISVSTRLNNYGLSYLMISVIVTEFYAVFKRLKNKQL